MKMKFRSDGRTGALVGLDVSAWAVAFVGTRWVQEYAESVHPFAAWHSLVVGLLCGVAFILVGLTVRLHQGRAAAGSFDDVVLVGTVTAVVAAGEMLAAMVV